MYLLWLRWSALYTTYSSLSWEAIQLDAIDYEQP